VTTPDAGSGQTTPPFHVQILERKLEDDSKDRETKRGIEKADADAHREAKRWFIKATIGTAIGISLLGTYITFNHKDSKVRELGVSLISAPIAGLFGVIAGMAFK
jgi:hypothetical protein